MSAPRPEADPKAGFPGGRTIQVSDRCARLVCPETAGLPPASKSSLPWRLRLRIWKANAEFRLLWTRRLHLRLVQLRLRLRLRWLKLRHGRRVPNLLHPAPPAPAADPDVELSESALQPARLSRGVES